MQRLAEFDVSRQFITRRGKLAAQLIFGVICAAAMIGLRSLYDIWAPESGPFAMIYPTVLLATFYGHWRAGLVSFVVTFSLCPTPLCTARSRMPLAACGPLPMPIPV